MYTVNKGPSKLVAKTRGGFSQNIEKIETIRELSRKCSANSDSNEINVPRPVFQQPRKTYHHHTKEQKVVSETVSPQHQELVDYIRDSWNIIAASNEANNDVPAKKIVYHEAPPSPILKDFGPFDLESWWGRRLFNNITKSL